MKNITITKKTMKINCAVHPIYDAYEFNELGHYRFIGSNNWITGEFNNSKYVVCTIRSINNDKQKTMLLHHAIWQTFRGAIPEKHEIDHIDNNTKNNQLSNLQCLTISENRKRRDHSFLEAVRDAKKNPIRRIKSCDLLTNEIFVFANKSRAAKYHGCSPALIYHICSDDNYFKSFKGTIVFQYTDEEVTKEVPRKIHVRKTGGYKYKSQEERELAKKQYAKTYRLKKKLEKLIKVE